MGRRSEYWCRVAMLFGFLAVLAGAPGAPAEEEIDPSLVHVDPGIGIDALGRGQAEAPFKTVSYALIAAEDAGLTALDIRLAPGRYRKGEGENAGEVFPLVLPRALNRLILAGQAPGVRFETSDPDEVLIQFAFERAGATVDVELRSLELAGGLAGACFLVGTGARANVVADGLMMSGQAGKGFEFFFEPAGEAACDLRNSRFEGSAGGAAFETATSSKLDLVIEDSTFRSLVPYGPSAVLGAAVGAHVDPLAEVNLQVARNVFHGVPSALELTASEDGGPQAPSGGRLQAVFVNNLVRGNPGEPGATGVQNAIYLSLWPHHSLMVFIAHNTFFGVKHVVFEDNFDLTAAQGGIPWQFMKNIARRIGGFSEFANEGPNFPPAGCAIVGNLLERSSLVSNFIADPLFVDEDAGDFHLTAASPARDRGNYIGYADPTDLAGNCRRSATSCPPEEFEYRSDLGAYEFPAGFCADVAVFARGNCNGAGKIDIGDPVFALGVLFLGQGPFPCADACDADDDGKVNIADPIYTLNFLFVGGRPSPPPRFEDGFSDPTLDCLPTCE
jgi:hypothetical protein